MIYNIYLIIPKDLQTKDLHESFVYASCTKTCKFVSDYKHSIKNNKITGRFLFVHNNGGLENFNIVLLESVDCNKDEISMYKMYQQNTVNNTIDVIKKIINN